MREASAASARPSVAFSAASAASSCRASLACGRASAAFCTSCSQCGAMKPRKSAPSSAIPPQGIASVHLWLLSKATCQDSRTTAGGFHQQCVSSTSFRRANEDGSQRTRYVPACVVLLRLHACALPLALLPGQQCAAALAAAAAQTCPAQYDDLASIRWPRLASQDETT